MVEDLLRRFAITVVQVLFQMNAKGYSLVNPAENGYLVIGARSWGVTLTTSLP